MLGDFVILPGEPRLKKARITVLESARVSHQIAEYVLPVMRDQNVSS
jgi:hypothetical protein